MGKIGKFAKAIYSAAVTGLGALGSILVGSTSILNVTAGQWVTIALLSLLSGGGVYGLSNRA